jgi:hypothetical protein
MFKTNLFKANVFNANALKKMMFLSLLIASPILSAASLTIAVEVPKLTVAEYHAPYAAVWLESTTEGDKKITKTLAVWYDTDMKDNGGLKWLKDLRQWWRRDGRDLQLPIDGVSGATKLSGVHNLNFTVGKAPLTELPKGDYVLLVEMSREVGGREVVKVPFSWPVKEATTHSQTGSTEVGAITLVLNP